MNKIFKVIWSKSKQCYIVVSEMAKNHSGKKKIVVASILAAMAVGADMSASVQANGLDGGSLESGVAYATAIGYGARVGSDSSLAIGTYSYAKGTSVPGSGSTTVDPSIAIGNGARAIGNSSLAIGMSSRIQNSYGVAVGRNTEVTGDYGVGIGYNSRSALHGIAMGEQARALKEGATTLGVSSRGYGKGAIAIGWQSLAGADVYTVGVPGSNINNDSSSKIDGYNNWGDMSVGLRAMATGGNATALGRNAAATAANAVAIGGGNGNSYDDNTERTVASGAKSAAIGYNSAASGTSASALGTKASASAENAAAIGSSASASAKDTLAAGSSALATAEGATAVGKAAKAQKSDATAVGSGATASEANATALGKGATASKGDATAVGSGAQATEANAVAVGKGAEASKGNAIAIGKESEAKEASATAIGDGANAEKADAIAIGTGATSGGGASGVAIGKGAQSKAEEATAIGAGSTAEKAHDSALGTSATASGGGSTAVGYLVNATGDQSFSAGSNTSASGEAAVGIGYKASATGNRAISIGGNNGNNVNQATGANSTAIGTGAQSTAGNATALGKGAIAKASDAMAFGTDAVAGNANATALGNGANAISTSGIAIGQGATVGVAAAGTTPAVDAPNSIAIGKNAKVLAGSGSIALGANTQITASDVDTSSGSAQKTYPYMLTNTKGTDAVADKENGIVAIGTKRSSTDTGFARRLTGVAGGVSDYDAVNLKQAKAIERSLKKGERHIKATSYSPDTAGTITLNYVDGENNDVSNETATITDVAKKSDEWMLRTQNGTTTTNANPQTVTGSTKKAVTLKAGDNIAIDNSGGTVTIKAKDVVTSITSGNATALTVSPSNGAVTITPNIASAVGANGQDGKLVTSGIVKTALDLKVNKTDELHVKAGDYTVGDDGNVSLIQENANSQTQNDKAFKIKDVAKQSNEWTLGIKTTTTTGTTTTSSVSNITPTAPSGSTKKVISLEAGKNIAIDANGNNVKISTTGLDFLSVKSDSTADKVMDVRSDITLKTNRDNGGATGQHSVAIGAYAEARNLSSTAIGNEVVAANNYATALGYNVANSGEGSVAIGKKVNVDKSFATTIGYHQNTTGNASASVNIGYQSTVKGNQSVGLGSTINIEDKAQYSTAIGYKAKTLDKNAIAIGSSNDQKEVIASGVSSVAIGTSAQSHSTSGLAIGDNAVVGIAEVKDSKGQVTTAAVDAKYSIALGTNAKVLAGQGSVAIGWGTEVGANDVKSSAKDADKVYPYLLDKSSGDEANDAGNGVVAIGKKRSSGDGQTIARRLTGLAGAVGDYDAVNLKQLKALEANEWLLRTQDGESATATDVTPTAVQGQTKKRVTLKAGDNIAIENNNGTVTIKAKDVVTSITSGNANALTVSPSNGAVTITPLIASSVGATGDDDKLVTSGIVKKALDAKIDKTAEMHIKTGEYTVDDDGKASLVQQDGTNQDLSTRVVIKDIAKKSVVDGINTTVGTHTTQISNLTTEVGGKVSQSDFDTFKAKAITFTGDDNDGVARTLGTTLTVKGGANYTSTTTNTNIQVVKDDSAGADGLLVKLSDTLTGIKSIAGDEKNNLIIKNGTNTVTITPGKGDDKGTVNFGDAKVIASNLEADITYRANSVADTAANTVKLKKGLNFVAATDATTAAEGPKAGLSITTGADGLVTFGLDKATREKVDNAADKNLSNLSDDGKGKVTELAKAAAKEVVKVAPGINTTVDTDTTTTEGVTTYKVNANDTKVAIAGDGLAISGGDLGATDRVREYTLDLSATTKGKLAAVGNLANVIGGTTITTDGTVTGPTFNITNATGGTDTANTLKDAIDKLNKTNEGQNTTISNLTTTVTNNYNDLSTKITNAGTAATAAATAKGLNFTGDDTTDNGKVHRDLGDTLTIKGGENFARGASENNIKVVKTSNDLDVKLAENLGNIKEIAGDGTHDLVIKNGDTKVTVKAPKDGNKGSIDFGDTKLVTNNLDANISYKAGTETDKNTVKLQDGFNFVAGTGTVAATTPATGATTTTSPTASTDNKAAKKGIVISTEANGVVNIGLDSDTRSAIDNAASKNYVENALTNLNSTITGNANLNFAGNVTKDAQDKDADKVGLSLATGTLHIKGDATDITTTAKGDTVTIGLTTAAQGKLTAVGNLANVIGGTTITTDGTVTGPTFNITNATGGTDTANTLKDAIDKLNKTNEGQNTTISNLTTTVTNNYNDLSTKITNAGTAATAAATAKGLNFTGDDTTDNGKVHRDLGDTLTIKGGENFARGASENNIKVVKTSNDLAVKLAENLGNIKEISGDGTHDLVIKNGDTKVTVKAPKDGNKGSIDFGDTKLVTNNLDANIFYKAGTETDKKTVKLQDGFNFVAGTGTVVPKHLEAGTTSPTEATDSVEPKKGIAISTAANGVVNIGLDSDTRGIIDNAASKDYVTTELANLNTTITGNANLNFAGNVTKDAQDADVAKVGLALATGTLHIKGDATDITTTAKGDTVTIALTSAAQGKLTAVGNLANVIGGTTIAADGTVTGPTFNITNATGGTDTANTLKDAIDKLNKTNEGQNTTISNLTTTVTNNYNDLSTKITNAGTAATAAATTKGLNFTGDDTTDNGKVHRDLGETLTIKGGENFTRGTSDNNIKVVKNNNDLDVKLAENLGNIKEIAGDGTHDLVIKNGDTKVTVKAPKDGNKGSIDFGDTKLVTNNLDANISYKAGTEADKKTVKLQDGFNFVAGTGTVVPKHLEAGTTSPTEATDSVEPKKGIAISTAANGVVNIGLDSDTRGIIDNAASKDYVATELANLNTTITGNANLNFAGNVTKDAQDADVAKVGLALATGTLHIKGDTTDITTTAKGDTVTIGLTDATKGKLTAVDGLATVIGGTNITADGTVTGPTFNITKADGTNETASTIKEAIEKLNTTNAGQNTAINNLTNTVNSNYNDLSTKITNAGTATTNALTEKGLDFYGNKDTEATDKVHRNLGEALKVKGAENFTREATATNNIDVVKNTAGDGFDVKLAENLGNIKEIAGDGTHDLVIKNGDTKVTVKAPKDGNKGSIDFGDTKLVTNNLDANISYKAGTEADKKTVKLQDGFNFVAGTGTVVPKHLEAGTTSPTEATDSVEPKKGIAISTAANGVVNIGLDSDTRGAIDNAADKNLSNLSETGNNKITNLAKAAAKETVKVADGINTTVDTDTTTTEGVTTYKVNAIDTKVAITGDGLAISGGDLGATDRVRTYTLDLSDATKGKLTAVGNLANVIGGTTIAADGTVTGPTFNITNAAGGTDTANTLKDAIDKLNKTNEGQNTTISNLTTTVTNNYNDLSTKITNAGTAATAAATAKGLNFTGDDTTDNGKVHRDLGDTLTIKGGENFARGASENNIKVVKTSNDLAVKLAKNLGNIEEISGDGSKDLVIKNGDTKVTVKAPKDGNTGSIDFGDTKLVTNNLDANISYKAGTETDKNTVKLQDGFNFVAGTGTVAATTPATGATTTTSPTASTDNKAAKKGIVISTEANGVVNIGLDSDTRGAIDNAADKNLSNLSEAGNNKITNLAKAAAKETVKVADGINTTVDTDTTTTEGVTTYKVNANDTKVAITGDGLTISGGELGATDRVRTYTLDLSDATKGKLTAVGNLANVIGGTTIAADGTVTGPTFNITNATGGTDTANTLKDAIDKLNKTNEGQNTTISNLTTTVTNNYNDLSTKITNAGTAATAAATAKGLNFTGDDTTDNGKVHRDLGDTLTIKGGENFARGASENNIKVVKTSNDLAVKLAKNLGNIEEISGDGSKDLVIKNGDTKVTVKAPKDGGKGSIDFGDTKLVTNNLDANIFYKAGTETDKKTVKLQDGFNFVAGTGTVVPKHLEAGTTSPTEATDSVEPKKGIAISTAANGVVNIGLDSDTRGAIDNASNQDLSNLTTAGKKVITDAAQGSVKVAAGKNVTIDTETKDNVTTYTVNANDTLVTSDNTLVTVNGGTLGEDKVRTYTLGLSTAVTDKLAQLSAKNADGRDGKLGSETDAIASKDIAKADGLNGETATYKVNALRHGEAGSVVYTDADGNRIVKATDGNYYKATEVNANGVVKTPAENNDVAPVAVEKATIVATLVNTNGTTAPEADDTNKVATTKLTNIKEAAITATSNDAVTGRQLYGLKSDLATYLGGDSKVNADGTFTGPTYNITKDDGTNTTDPVKNVGDAITKLDTRINNANTTLSTKGLDFYGNKDAAETDKVHRNLGQALKVKGAENFTREATATNNIDVVKNTAGDGFDVKLAENLGNIKEIAGNGTDNLVIKNGDATITVKPGKAGSTDPDTGTVTPPTNPSVDFGNTTLVVKNIEADITYRANNAEDADAHTVKLKKGLNFVAGTGTAAPKHLEAGTTSPTATTDSVEPKKGIVISTGANGVVNIGLDNDTRSAIDNAANQDLSNLTTAGKKVITDAAQGAVKVAAGNNITVDTETKDNVTKYTVNGRDTIVKAAENGSVSVTGGTLNDKGEREYTVDLTDATKAQINRIDGIDTRLTTAEKNITTLQVDMKQAKQDITTLQGDMIQAKTDITTLQGDMKQAKQDITNNTNNIATNTQSIKDNKADIEKLKGNSANKYLSNLTNAGKDVVTGLVNVVGTNGITVTDVTDTVSRVKTFTAKLDDKVTFGQGDKQITVDGTTGTITAPNATINAVNTSTVQVGDANKTNTAVTPEGVTVTTKQPDGTVTSTVIIKDGTVSGLTNTKWDPTKVTDTDRSKAATQGQMKDVSDTLQKGRVFAADTGVASATVALGGTLAIKGGAKGKLIDGNIGVELTDVKTENGVTTPATMMIRLKKDMDMQDGSTSYDHYMDIKGKSVKVATTKVDGTGVTITPVKGLDKPSVTLTADGLNNGGNAIHNVGPGTAPNDAATVGQVSAAAGTLSRRVNEVGAHAAALAAMNPLSYDPLKKSQVMAGYGSYKGNSALALGVAHYANEDTLFNVGVSVGNGENMVNAGVTYRFGGEDSMIPERYKGGPISSVYVMQDEITALKAENARKDVENAKKEAENEEMKAQIKMLIERVTMLEAKK